MAKVPGPTPLVELWPIERLLPYSKNARTHSQAQIGQLVASMLEWGWTVPILVDEGGLVIAGHARLQAAQALEYTDVPVIVARGWTDAQKRAYTIADNKLALNAGWDEELLAFELDELRDMEFDVSLIGFSTKELNDLIGTDKIGPEPASAYREQYGVIVVCLDEAEQESVYNELVGQGRNCRVVST